MIVIASNDQNFTRQCKAHCDEIMNCYEGHLTDLHALTNLLKKPQPTIEILILDMALLGKEGINEVTQLLEYRPNMNLLVFVENRESREEISAILFGAKAYCEKSMDMGLLAKIIDAVLQGEIWVDRLFVTRLLAEIRDISNAKHQEAQHLDHGIKDLTPRENQIADLVANGSTNGQIADKLLITERTVKAHMGAIFKKMHVKDRLQLAIALNRHHQIPLIWHGMVSEVQPPGNDESTTKNKPTPYRPSTR